jgi:hypothetical protein
MDIKKASKKKTVTQFGLTFFFFCRITQQIFEFSCSCHVSLITQRREAERSIYSLLK